MATTTANDKKTAKPNAFVRFFSRIANAFKDMYAEMKKVTWPSRQDLINYSLVVLVFMVFMGVVIGAFDSVASTVVRWIVGA